MNFLSRAILCVTIMILCACGIKGQPLSPSEVKTVNKKQPLFALGEDTKKSKAEKQNKKNYVSTAELEQIGYDYSANFGVENDDLDDVFERIKPQSALRKKRNTIPLGRE